MKTLFKSIWGWVTRNPIFAGSALLTLLIIVYLLRGCGNQPVPAPKVEEPTVDTTAVAVWRKVAETAQSERDVLQRKLDAITKEVTTKTSEAKYWSGKYKEAKKVADQSAQLQSCDSLVAVIDEQSAVIHEQNADMNNLVEAWDKEVAAKDSLIAAQGRVNSELRIALSKQTDETNRWIGNYNSQIKKINRERNFGKLGTIGGVVVGAAAVLLIKK